MEKLWEQMQGDMDLIQIVRNYAFDNPAVTLTLISVKMGGDDPNGDGPRVADTNHKQQEHTDSHQS